MSQPGIPHLVNGYVVGYGEEDYAPVFQHTSKHLLPVKRERPTQSADVCSCGVSGICVRVESQGGRFDS